MTAPPRKRQRRFVVPSSSSPERERPASRTPKAGQESAGEITKSSLPSRIRPRRSQPKPAKHDDPPTSPPPRSRPRKTKDQAIPTFFTASVERQRSVRELGEADVEEIEDPVQDGALAHPVGYPRPSGRPEPVTESRSHLDATSAPPGRPELDDSRPWVDKYAPTTLDEIAVHPKKVDDVRRWIVEAFAGRSPKRLLVLRGPSGAGKSTTVSLLSRTLNFDLLEWREPVSVSPSSTGHLSALAQFRDFLDRGARYDTLNLLTRRGHLEGDAALQTSSSSKNRLILLEEYPNTFTGSSDSLRSFRSIIQQHLAALGPPSTHGRLPGRPGSPGSIVPLVMVLSETVLTTGPSADHFTAHRLLGRDLLEHAAVSLIDFNPIARTLLSKAMDTVIRKEASLSGRRTIPGPALLEKIGDVGDIRSAIGALELICLRNDDGAGDWGGKIGRSKPGRTMPKALPLTETERETLDVVTQRETSLGMFHAVAKVLYNKRDQVQDSGSEAPSVRQPPSHLPQHVRTKRSLLSMDDLVDQIGTDVQTFIGALHENYPASCHGPSDVDTLESINGCLDAFSDCDLLDSTSQGGNRNVRAQAGLRRSPWTGLTKDSLRQEEICFQTAVRGLLFALPSPVRRRLPSSQTQRHQPDSAGHRRADAHRMYYPISLKLWRQAEELEGALDGLMVVMRTADLTSKYDHPRRHTKTSIVESWKGRTFDSLAGNVRSPGPFDGSNDRLDPYGWNCSRADLILERLPYMSKTLKSTTHSRSWVSVELDKITAFKGIDLRDDQGSEDDDQHENVATVLAMTERKGKPSPDERPSNLPSHTAAEDGPDPSKPWNMTVEKLTLSDDEIEVD